MSLAATQRKSKATEAKTAKSTASKRLSSHVVSKQRGLESAAASVDLDALEARLRREFDLENKFGPVTGMTRMERWERAQRMGLDPPSWVRDEIAQQGLTSAVNHHLFGKSA